MKILSTSWNLSRSKKIELDRGSWLFLFDFFFRLSWYFHPMLWIPYSVKSHSKRGNWETVHSIRPECWCNWIIDEKIFQIPIILIVDCINQQILLKKYWMGRFSKVAIVALAVSLINVFTLSLGMLSRTFWFCYRKSLDLLK